MTQVTKFDIPTTDIVQTVSFSPYEWSNDLFAYGTAHHVIIDRCKILNTESTDDDEKFSVECERIRDFHHGNKVNVISWSPTTNLLSVPQHLRLATVGSDNKVKILTSDLKDNEYVKVIDGHSSFVNDVAFEPVDGDLIASVSDDLTCRLWKSDEAQQVAIFPLAAPGMRVQWHPQDPMKILVADKCGTIRFYSTVSNQPILSMETNLSPTLTADWCFRNPLIVTALSSTDWILFDTTRPSRAVEDKYLYAEGGTMIRWSKSHDHLIATLGLPNAHLKIISTRNKQEVAQQKYAIARSLTWHQHLPVLAVGGDKKIHFWHVDKV